MWLYVNEMYAVFVGVCTRSKPTTTWVCITFCAILLLFTPHQGGDGQQMMKKLII